MKRFFEQINEVIKSGLAIELSHFFITLILLVFTILIIHRILVTVESKKYERKHLGEKVKGDNTLWLPVSLQKWIKKHEKIIRVPVMPIITKYFVFGLFILFVIPFLAIITEQNVPIFISITLLITFFVMYVPFNTIKTMVANRKNMINLELPEFLESFALLKQQQTLFQATMNSVSFAGPTIRPFVEKLILDVQLRPGSTEPYKEFAKELDHIDVSTFMNTMIETIHVDQKLESELIAEELKQVARMREDVYEAIIDKVEAKVGSRNMILTFPIIVITLVFMLYTMSQIINDSGIM